MFKGWVEGNGSSRCSSSGLAPIVQAIAFCFDTRAHGRY